jgi:phosphoribosyl 1,2-cyclic phosphodiesterase
LLTHDHADACFGLDDLRFFASSLKYCTNFHRGLTFKQGPSTPIRSPIAVHASPATHSVIIRMFAYLEDPRHSSGHGIAPFTWNLFDESKPFHITSCGDIQVIPLPVQHGRDHAPVRQPYICMGFRIRDFSYISDTSFIPEDTRAKLDGTRTLVLDALRERPHPSHFNFDEVAWPQCFVRLKPQAKAFIKSIRPPPEITYLTGISHDTDHYWLEGELRNWSLKEGINVVPAYDGLKISL